MTWGKKKGKRQTEKKWGLMNGNSSHFFVYKQIKIK
jgi:hypothetical protein